MHVGVLSKMEAQLRRLLLQSKLVEMGPKHAGGLTESQ